MTKKSADEVPTVELCAHSIECRVVGDELTLESVSFQIGLQSEPDEPRLVMYMDARITRFQAVNMLNAIVARIRSNGLPETKIVLPGEVVKPLDGILKRILKLPDRERDGVVDYIEERLTAISGQEVGGE